MCVCMHINKSFKIKPCHIALKKIFLYPWLFISLDIFHTKKKKKISHVCRAMLAKPHGTERWKTSAISPKNNVLRTFILPFILRHHHFLKMKQNVKHFRSADTPNNHRDLLLKGERITELPALLSPPFCTAVAANSAQCTLLLCGH